MPQKIEIIRSESVQEILSNKPGFLVQYGISIFLCIVSLLCIICWFIQYPDVINTTAKLTSINAPKEVIANTSGKLVKLAVSEKQSVHKNQVLGFIESTANHNVVINLSNQLDTFSQKIETDSEEIYSSFCLLPDNEFGELQSSYQVFSQAFINFKNYIASGFYLRKKTMLAKDINNLYRLHTNLSEQKTLIEKDVSLSKKTFDANQSLKEDKIISDFDYRIEESKLINKKLTLPQINSSIINNEALQNEKQKEIAELENTILQQKSIFRQALNTFKSQIDDWKKKYLLTAPITGNIAMATFLQENQQLQANQTICYVNPEKSDYFAQTIIPQSNLGKVGIGNHVLLKFPSYPHQEYGNVIGKIEFISNIPTDSGYLAKVLLPNGLRTNYNKHIQFREGLIANTEIVTKEMRLLHRFYYTILQQVTN